jgi:hypothetical protein
LRSVWAAFLQISAMIWIMSRCSIGTWVFP